MQAANAADADAKPIGNAETIRRWLRDGAPGLVYELISPEEEGQGSDKS